jgi:triosephosphate isomerase
MFCANFKMNRGPSEARAYMATFLGVFTPRDDRTVAIFPPALSLSAARDARGDRQDIALGVQNIHWEDKGAFTGESSAPMARDAGAALALVGHSERRHVFGETDEETAKKCQAAVRNGLVPVLCVGEKMEQREADETETVVVRQLRAGIARLTSEQVGAMIVAYEPVWAIGTGRTATPEDAAVVHRVIRASLREVVGEPATTLPILYGGSVNQDNARALLAVDGVDGLLVGGACLDPQTWASICRTDARATRT